MAFTLRHILITLTVMLTISTTGLHARPVVVADSTTRIALPNASVYDRHGSPVGISNNKGELPFISRDNYPITIRYLGFNDRTVSTMNPDTVFLTEDISELPEVVFESRKQRVLHILAYVREYSTLTTYTDTVFLFREKMVDYMLTPDRKVKFKGWSTPRLLTSRSYYRFTDQHGLDSVSDASQHHFSWSDWMGMAPPAQLPFKLRNSDSGTDTLNGKYSPTELWRKENGRLSVDINVMADTTSRKWVPNISGFFRGDLDFEKFSVCFNYNNITGDSVSATDLTGYSYNIESRGRGHDMFRFNRINEPFFVSTDAEVYILDKEYITLKEAKKWANRKFDIDETGIYEPMDAPPLASSIQELIARVNNLDKNSDRLDIAPDKRLISLRDSRKNFKIGHRALFLLKHVTGISSYRSRKNLGRNWNEFSKAQISKNQNKTD